MKKQSKKSAVKQQTKLQSAKLAWNKAVLSDRAETDAYNTVGASFGSIKLSDAIRLLKAVNPALRARFTSALKLRG